MAQTLTRKQQAEQTKRALFEKGREVLKDVHSFDDFVVEDITDACGVSKGTFYLYFKSKGAFFYNVKLAEVAEMRDGLTTILEDTSVSTRESILAFVRQWVRNVGHYDITLGQKWVSHVVDDDSRNTTDPEGERLYVYQDLLLGRVEYAVQNGEFLRSTPVERVVESILVVIHGFDTLSLVKKKQLDYGEWETYAAELVDDGILRRWLA